MAVHKGILVPALVLLSALLLTACMVGPNYVRPSVVLGPKFKEVKNNQWKPIHPQVSALQGEWWKIFQDPKLNALEAELNRYNQNIVLSVENYRQSQALVDLARASFFPTLTGAFTLLRQKQVGTTTATSIASTSSAPVPTITNYTAALNATWEPDIWGLVGRTVESKVAIRESNAALVASTRLSAQGALAQYYFELRTLDTSQKLLDDTCIAYEKTLKLTRHQYASGVASRADIIQAQSQLETAQAQAINNGILRGQYEHAIAVLMGRPPSYLSLKMMPLKFKVPNIPVEIPSVWIERRPDIFEAERLVQSGSALIGVAIAAYFPTITLSSSGTASASSLSKLIHTPTLGWSTGLALVETFIDAGARAASVNAAKAAYLAQVAAYRQVVLSAFQDVEDNLVASRLLKEESVMQDKAALSAKLALKLVLNEYKAGTVAYTNVLASQILAYNAEKAANDVHGLQMVTAVTLIKALGGGWRNESSQQT